MRATFLFVIAIFACSSALVLSAVSPRSAAASPITTSYAKKAIRRYINRKYSVALGPYFGACLRLASNKVRCDVEFKAGLYWRCGRVSVRSSGDFDYISARLPIGC